MRTIDLDRFMGLFDRYTELRLHRSNSICVRVDNGCITQNTPINNGGVSARTFSGGCWGFAALPEADDASIGAVVEKAAENAALLAGRSDRAFVELPSSPADISRDLSSGSRELSGRELMDFIMAVDSRIAKRYPELTARTINLRVREEEKKLVTSDGSRLYSLVPGYSIYVIMATEHDGEPVHLLESCTGLGRLCEAFREPGDLFDMLDWQHEHLMKKAEGVYTKTGTRQCVLSPHVTGLLAHEAIGHTTEADIVRGGSVAGDGLGEKVASHLITLVDFACEAYGEICPSPVFIDDEGVSANDALLIEDGVLKGFMHSRESAAFFDVPPTGNARAAGYADEPIIRMRNTAILPGESTLDEIIGSVDDGYYLMRTGCGQADSTGEFMVGVTLGYEIKKGRLGRAIRETTTSGNAFKVLGTVTSVSNDMYWWCGLCGKKQMIPVGMGGPAIKCMMTIGGR